MTTHFYGDRCLEPHGTCTHESASGVDQTEGPAKVWCCDGCGWLHRYEVRDGISRAVNVTVLSRRLLPSDADNEARALLPHLFPDRTWSARITAEGLVEWMIEDE